MAINQVNYYIQWLLHQSIKIRLIIIFSGYQSITNESSVTHVSHVTCALVCVVGTGFMVVSMETEHNFEHNTCITVA